MPSNQPTAAPSLAREDPRSPWTKLMLHMGRAFTGALIFSLPMLMTMEMWWLGFYMDRTRLILLIVVFIPVLAVLVRFSGFERTDGAMQATRDAFIAYAVGFVASAFFLWLLAVIGPGMPIGEIIGKVALQAVPASIGAALARSQLGGSADRPGGSKEESYLGELFLIGVGALFLAFNVAPTEEMVLIAYRMTTWQALLLALVSLALMHTIVYAAGFHGQHQGPEGSSLLRVFLRWSVVGYGVALLISLYVLWTFGRTDNASPEMIVMTTVVLGFPAALGGAAARLVL